MRMHRHAPSGPPPLGQPPQCCFHGGHTLFKSFPCSPPPRRQFKLLILAFGPLESGRTFPFWPVSAASTHSKHKLTDASPYNGVGVIEVGPVLGLGPCEMPGWGGVVQQPWSTCMQMVDTVCVWWGSAL